MALNSLARCLGEPLVGACDSNFSRVDCPSFTLGAKSNHNSLARRNRFRLRWFAVFTKLTKAKRQVDPDCRTNKVKGQMGPRRLSS